MRIFVELASAYAEHVSENRPNFMKRLVTFMAAALAAVSLSAQKKGLETFLTDSIDTPEELLEHIENLPNIEVGKGITFRPKNDSYEMTIRFRMQNMVGLHFNDGFDLKETEAQIKRLRLRFDGYIFSPKFIYSIQLGFSGYDAKNRENGQVNIIRDAIVYYRPSPDWNIGFGQTKLKTNRARINSSSALQFVDRSIVNSEFGGDRDFGFFGEYHYGSYDGFALAALASVTMGEGRNWSSSSTDGLDYTGRVEIFPFGRFHAKGEYTEGDTEYEERVKLMVAGGYSFNHNASLVQSFKGDMLPDGATRNIGSYYADIVLKYRGFAFNADYMGRHLPCGGSPVFDESGTFVYTGCGVNVQASYLFDRKWEIALRNSTMLPDKAVQGAAGYRTWNQSTIGVTRYIIGHSLKVQMDVSYNCMDRLVASPLNDRWSLRFQVELGL